MAFKFFKNRKIRKQEVAADEEVLDAVAMLKEGLEIYLNLLAKAHERGDVEAKTRLAGKLNNAFEFYDKSWNGEIKLSVNMSSKCYLETHLNSSLKLDS